MNRFLEIIFICLIFCSCTSKRTELVLLGTVHQPVQNFTPDSLYNILVKVKPDLILFEVDSSFFTKEFDFKKTWESNENIATVRYMNNFDVDVRPYEFTGRNEYRLKIGSRPTDNKALELLDSFYKNNQLNSLNNRKYQNFLKANDTLNSFAYLDAKAFNNPETDRAAEIRQKYHYKELLGIMSEYPIFSDTYYVKSDGDSISYYEGFKRASEFWDLRNQTMAKNILHFVRAYHGKKIIVLNGYFHRYYLNSLLRHKEEKLNFTIKEFYEY